MPALSSFSDSNTSVTTFEDIKTHIVTATGSQSRAFIIDDVVTDATGWTIIFASNARPQFRNTNAFTFGGDDVETTIIEAGGFTLNGTTYTAAGAPGRTNYWTNSVGGASTGGRFHAANQTNTITFKNVNWEVAAAGSGDDAAKNFAFNINGGASNAATNTERAAGMPMVFEGVFLYGRFGDSLWYNKNLVVRNYTPRGYGWRIQLQDTSSGLAFPIGFAAIPDTQPNGLVLERYSTGTTVVKSDFQVVSTNESLVPGDTNFIMRNADVAGVDMFNVRTGGSHSTMAVTLIDPVGEISRGGPSDVVLRQRGNIRIMRTVNLRYTGAAFANASDEHCRIDNTTSNAPSWAEPGTVEGHTGGVFTATLAIKALNDGSSTYTNYTSYNAKTVGYGYDRNSTNFTLPTSVTADPDQTIALRAATLGDGSAITGFTAGVNNEIENLDELVRASKKHEVDHPTQSENQCYIIKNDQDEYEIKTPSGTAGNVQWLDTAHSSYFTVTNTHFTIHNADGTIGAGTAKGLRAAGITASSGITLDFPRADNAGTIRRVSVTGALNWVGGVFTDGGVNIGGLLTFSSGNLTRSFFTSNTGNIILATAQAGYIPGRNTGAINSSDPLSVAFTILGGAEQTLAKGGAKYSSTKSGSAFGVASFDTSTFSDPSAYIEVADRQIDSQAAYSIFSLGLTTIPGLAFIAANGDLVDFEDIESSGQFVFLKTDAQFRRAAAGNSNAALIGEPVRPDGMYVEDDRGGVPYTAGISLSGIDTKLDALQTAVNAIDGGGASVAEIVAGIQAADFGSAAGTQTLQTLLGNLNTAITAKPTSAQVVTALQAANFAVSGTNMTLAQMLNVIRTNIETVETDVNDLNNISTSDVTTAITSNVPTATQNAAATWNYSGDIDTTKAGVQTPGSLIVAIPTAEAIATAVLGKSVESNVDLLKALRILLAVLTGTTNREGTTREFKRLDSNATTIIRATVNETDRERATVTVL